VLASRHIITSLLTCLYLNSALSGVLRCSRRASIVVLKVSIDPEAFRSQKLTTSSTTQDRFVRETKSIKLPPRRDAAGNISAEYQAKLIQLHGAILGITAL
jgi:proteasome activator subunit 4